MSGFLKPCARGFDPGGMANDGDPSRRRDLVLGVVVPAAVFGPFVAFGLVAILVTGLGPADGRGC